MTTIPTINEADVYPPRFSEAFRAFCAERALQIVEDDHLRESVRLNLPCTVQVDGGWYPATALSVTNGLVQEGSVKVEFSIDRLPPRFDEFRGGDAQRIQVYVPHYLIHLQ